MVGLLGLAAIAGFAWYRGWSRAWTYGACALWWVAQLPGYIATTDGRDPAGWVKFWGAIAVAGVVGAAEKLRP